jgi:hypothetical protein
MAKENPWRKRLADVTPAPEYTPLGTAMEAAPKVQSGVIVPTDEQIAIVDASKTGNDMIAEAFAGASKTTVCRMIAEARPRVPMKYLAYNRAIADDAKGSFPHNTTCQTVHSLAYRAIGHKYMDRIKGPRVTAKMAASILRISPMEVGGIFFNEAQLGRMVMNAINRFCYSADPIPGRQHFEFTPGMETFFDDLTAMLDPYLLAAWRDIERLDGRLKFTHDMYLKLWVMSQPVLDCDVVFQDEAQDANPLITQLVMMQTSTQKILVGDRYQQIYGWRGAVDAMQSFETELRLRLTKSFRFGESVANEANKFLTLLGNPASSPLVGFEQVQSEVAMLDDPDCILCRTNAEAVNQAIIAQDAGRKAAIVGGTQEIKAFTEASQDLKAGRGTYHPDLFVFQTWADVQEYAADDAGKDLKVMVNLIDRYGAETILRVCANSVEEREADVIVSTAHKAKGREWDRVKIASDFSEPGSKGTEDEGTLTSPDDPVALLEKKFVQSELMLNYVAVTRAKKVLDNSSLSWVNRWLDLAQTPPLTDSNYRQAATDMGDKLDD